MEAIIEIQSRNEVSRLVRTFYAKVRKNPTLGPIFNTIVHDWEVHLERLTDFWEMVLLHSGPGAGKFSPVPVHREVDDKMDHQVSESHFNTWLALWFDTIDSQFKGEVAEYAKQHAHKMAHILFFKIMEGRMET
ncbi:group III truncated hemoglobin [Cecembia calidifontis]|jgi:hemoglobin|uniref:Hemoglobin n=1 Tax=Cecembia calidifontis TaxID=1187080 RepID=A0A4Q7PE21_9BACT|nr:group III truncated hemoglobin [Cecembia calidifontis]RZS98683.1 hemoglobin [Cecembia calidifontis]